MKKLLIVGMLGLCLNSFSQTISDTTSIFNSVFNSLNRRSFEFEDFSDSVKFIVIKDNELFYNNYSNKTSIVLDLNTILLYMFKYDTFTLSKAISPEGLRGFIANISTKIVTNQIYMVLDDENKIKIVLIK